MAVSNGHPVTRKELQTEIKEQMATKNDLNPIISTLDHLVTTYTLCWNKLTVHDERIRTLEEKVGAPPSP